jgi:hypothetical protein
MERFYKLFFLGGKIGVYNLRSLSILVLDALFFLSNRDVLPIKVLSFDSIAICVQCALGCVYKLKPAVVRIICLSWLQHQRVPGNFC